MKARTPNFDFSASLPHWNPSIEFSQSQNGGSLILPALEPFLNKVMARARKELTGADPGTVQLKADITTFIRQESNHYTLHGRYNQRLYDHYDGLEEIVAEYAAELDRFLAERPLDFLLAYCDAFETVGPVYADVWMEHLDDLLAGSTGGVDLLWKWHWCEEYEHRCVVFDTFKQLYGNRWLYRMKMLAFTLGHIRSFAERGAKLMLRADRAAMTPDEKAASRERARLVSRTMARRLLPRLVPAVMPFYHPRRRREPLGMQELMQSIDAMCA